jgi:hypothetical protein
VSDKAELYRTPSAELGVPLADLDQALQLAGELEDEELIKRMRVDEGRPDGRAQAR